MSITNRIHKNTFLLLDGMKIAFQEWGNTSSPKKILASHGWLDNSSTYSYLGPYLGTKGYHVIAIDYCGHGLSSHVPRGFGLSLFQKYAYNQCNTVDVMYCCIYAHVLLYSNNHYLIVLY